MASRQLLDRLDAWIAREQPGADLRIVVTEWLLTRFESPYSGVRRAPGFDNLWYARIPDSLHDTDKVVVCSYFIFEQSKVLRCDHFSTLSLPLG